MTLAEAARARCFFDALRSQGKRPATVGAYESDWRRFARWYRDANGEPFDVARTVAREVAEFRSHWLRAGQAPATVNRRLVFIAEYARWAAERGDLPKSAADDIARVAKVRQQPLAPRGLNNRELRRLLKEVDLRAGARDRALMYLLLFTGLRLGEAASLRREDIAISARKGTVRVRGDHAKGGKERLVPLPPAARSRGGRCARWTGTAAAESSAGPRRRGASSPNWRRSGTTAST